ncbi:YhcH/YjgK/YiaL family protein [Mycoplasma sp. Pen4]|uniref:YhcH/YjgK/YiaL family protein n=1 Tax=Mycoplasma sp. Pen4 TaxID=640330 RepID=UPI00165405B7|nr:YhcH/YjgK/YiaL family protein [Mycoplasma sp. Pen4]QNM93803.1 YhcH/YjgK/YiaL family protein [Mycoplasma sp. Pen4]
MIFDKLSNIKNYKFENKALEKALEIAQNINIDDYEDGLFEIEKDIKVFKRNFNPFYEDVNFGELHDQHVDIHLFANDIDEIIEFDSEPKFSENDILDAIPANDVVFIKTPTYSNKVRVSKGDFALFFPGELHKVLNTDSNYPNKKKLIIKVKIK